MLTVKEIQAVIKKKIPDSLVVPEHNERGHFYRHKVTKELYPSVTTKGGILDSPHLKKWSANQAVKHIDKNKDMLMDAIKQGQQKVIDSIYQGAVLAHQDQFEDAGDIGTKGHDVVDNYLKKWIAKDRRPADITKFVDFADTRILAITRSAEQFCLDFDVIPIVSELRVASIKYGYAGMLDALMMVARVLKPGDDPECMHNFWNSNTGHRKSNRFTCRNCYKKILYEFSLVDWKTSNSIDKPEYAMQVSAYWYAFWEMTGLRPVNIFVVRLDKNQKKYDAAKIPNRSGAFKAFKYAAGLYDWLEDGNTKLVSVNKKERIFL